MEIQSLWSDKATALLENLLMERLIGIISGNKAPYRKKEVMSYIAV